MGDRRHFDWIIFLTIMIRLVVELKELRHPGRRAESLRFLGPRCNETRLGLRREMSQRRPHFLHQARDLIRIRSNRRRLFTTAWLQSEIGADNFGSFITLNFMATKAAISFNQAIPAGNFGSSRTEFWVDRQFRHINVTLDT